MAKPRGRLSKGAKAAIVSIAVAVTGSAAAAAVTGFFGLIGPAKPTLTVAGVSLTTSSTSFNVQCPATFTFTGTIDVAGGKGTIVYRWLRADGFGDSTAAGDRETVEADGPGSIVVTDQWTPNVPIGTVSRTVSVEILSPGSHRSRTRTISGNCNSTLPSAPPVPPPDVDQTP